MMSIFQVPYNTPSGSGSVSISLSLASQAISYPVDWFETHKSKPEIILYSRADGNVDSSKFITDSLNPGGDVNYINWFLADYIKANLAEVALDDWESYGVKICSVGDQISPMTLMSVKDGGVLPPFRGKETDPLTQIEKNTMFRNALAGYRYNNSSEQGNYRSKQLKNMREQFMKPPFQVGADLLESDLLGSSGWCNDPNFRKIIAALDMFYSKMKHSQYSTLKVATVQSRLRDCTIINSLRYFQQLMNLDLPEAMQYIWDIKCVANVRHFEKDSAELNNTHSYFAYMSDFGLVIKSPFSTSENAALHNWINCYGIFIGDERARNAKKFSEEGLLETINATKFQAYYRMQKGSASLPFTQEAMYKSGELLKKGAEQKEDSEMKTDNLSLFQKYIKGGYRVPDEINDYYRRSPIFREAARPGTIYAYIQSLM